MIFFGLKFVLLLVI